MRYYADFIDVAADGPRQPFLDTDIYYVTDLDRLRRECRRAAAQSPGTTFLILDEDLRVVDAFGWLRRAQQRVIDAHRLREGGRRRSLFPRGGLLPEVRERLSVPGRQRSPRNLLPALAEALDYRRRCWMVVFELEADRGYYAGEYVGLPARRYRLAARMIVPVLLGVGRRLRRWDSAYGARRTSTEDTRDYGDVPF